MDHNKRVAPVRKLLVIVLLATLAVAAPASPASADHGEDWICVGVMQLDLGVCQQNPLPHELPIEEDCRNGHSTWDLTCPYQDQAWDVYWTAYDELPMDTVWGVYDLVMDTVT